MHTFHMLLCNSGVEFTHVLKDYRNYNIAQLPLTQPWRTFVNQSHEYIENRTQVQPYLCCEE